MTPFRKGFWKQAALRGFTEKQALHLFGKKPSPHNPDIYPQNAPGKWAVDNQCIDCDLCVETAPANFSRNASDGHAYVSKQPCGPKEEKLCHEAMGYCPVNAIIKK